MALSNHKANHIVDHLMMRLESGELSKIGIQEIRAAINESEATTNSSQFACDQFERMVTEELVRRN